MNDGSTSSRLDNFKEKFARFLDKINTPFVQKVGNTLIEKKYLYPSFLLPIGIMLLVYAALGMYPFGSRTILTLDMNAQYIYFFEQFRDAMTGNGSFLYTFERALGGEFFGFYTYYLASPLSLIVVLFPEKMITEAVMLMMLLKCGFSGLTFAIYLDKTRKKNTMAFTAFSVMYALCAYATAYQSNTMWMDALIWLPLVTLSIERLVTDGKFKLFVITLALTIWSNYYIGYMVCIYVALYFFCFICAHPTDAINNVGETKHKLKSLARIAVCSAVAILICSLVILTAYYSLTFGKSSFQQSNFEPTLRFDFLDLFAKFFIGSYDTVRPDGLPNVYSGILMLIMIPVYFVSKKVTGREKTCFAVLCAVFIASFSVNTIDLVWHGFQMPVWLNYRYSFILTFILLIMAYKGFESYFDVEYKFIGGVGAVLILAMLVIQKTVTLTRYISGEKTDVMPDYEMIWLSVAFILIYLVVLYSVKHSKLKSTASVVLLTVVCIEAFSGSLINWAEEVSDVGWATRSSYRDYIDGIQPAVDSIYEQDSSFYRFEKTMFRKPNDNFALNIRGLSNSTSSLNKSSITLLKKLGFTARSHWSKYFSGNEAVDSILGVKYVITPKEDTKGAVSMSSLYNKLRDVGDYSIYENPYVLPIAYTVDPKIKEMILEDENIHSPFVFTNKLIGYMVGDESCEIFKSCNYYEYATRNCSAYEGAGNIEYRRSSDSSTASFTYMVTAVSDGSIYMYLPSKFSTKVTFYVNDEKVNTFFEDDTYRIQNLGNYKAGDKIRVEFTFDHYRIYLYNDGPFFVQIDEEKLSSVMGSLKEGGYNIEKYSDTRFEGTVSSDSDKVMFTTIPYDEGWKVYVDGKKVDIYKTVDALLAFDISEGEHTVVMKYVPGVFVAGVCLSIFGIALFVAMCVMDKKFRNTKSKKLLSGRDDVSDSTVSEGEKEIKKETD